MILIVGASLAGLRAAEAVREGGYEGELTILGEERAMPYDRPPLSKEVLLGEKGAAEVLLPVAGGLDARWRLGERAVGLDPVAKRVRTEAGEEVGYDSLILATGSGPRRLPGLEPDGERVLEVRTIEDALKLAAALGRAERLLIVGSGFIGVEVASAARARGVAVSVVTLDPPLVAAGHLVSRAAAAMLAANGVELHEEHTVASLERRPDGVVATLDEGTTIAASLAVVAVGAAPNVGWLEGSGLELENGVVCDAELRAVGAEDVYAAGDVARWPNPLFAGRPMRIEHWANAIEQGDAVGAAVLAGAEARPFASLPSVWSDHFGTRLQVVGLPALADSFDVVAGEGDAGEFAALALLEGNPVGAVSYGMRRDFAKLRARIRSELPVSGSIH
ncbi:MAG: FAD-dependent oxidoreductase [Actinobacteria bacterium]|nr:FAD-dependent oxidoreductase [Actinomycetota bacterium]